MVHETDVLVIGAGGAGCQAAAAAADAGARVTPIDKGRLGRSGSTFDPFTRDKGITVAVEGFNPAADPAVHFQQAIDAARGLADPRLVRAVAYEGPERFRECLALGLAFKPNRLEVCFGSALVGAFVYQSELATFFRRQVEARPITLLERTMVTSLLVSAGRCCGALAVTRTGQVVALRARAVILATGGASAIFRYHFSNPLLTGDGHAMALRAGAQLANLEFYQAILGTTGPVRLFLPQWYLAGNPPFYNAQGRRFLADYLPTGVDPAQLVSARSQHGPFTSSRPTRWFDLALDAEIKAGRGSASPEDSRRLAGIYCDFSALPEEARQTLDLRAGRPALAWLQARGADLRGGPVPVAPFAHAFNGGVVTDEHGRTAVPGLYACGEVAAGPHGANRVGGHMLAVLLVMGARAGSHAATWAAEAPAPDQHAEAQDLEQGRVRALTAAAGPTRPVQFRRAVQQAMAPVMIAKDEGGLAAAEQALAEVEAGLASRVRLGSRADLFEAVGVGNLALVAWLVARAARLRRESRGAHYRADYPEEGGEAYAQRLIWRLEDEQCVVSWEERMT